MSSPPAILCAHPDPALRDRLRQVLDAWLGPAVTLADFTTGEALITEARDRSGSGGDVAMIFCGVELPDVSGVEVLRRFHREPDLRGCRRIVLDGPGADASCDELLREAALHARVDPSFEPAALRDLLRGQLTDYVTHTAPHQVERLHPFLDLGLLGTAFLSEKSQVAQLSSRLNEVQTSVIDGAAMSEDQIEATMIREFDALLDEPPRQQYAPGEVMVREGDQAGRIWVLLAGRVKLFRSLDGSSVTFHSERAGRIVGLMSLSLQNPVFFGCEAVTPVSALVLSREQVRDAITRSPLLASCLITVILRSMARRNRRAVQLLSKVHQLNRRLEKQRDDLETALADLQAAQQQLVESEKMATLGTLAAGMAHELNNPVAAMQNAVRYLLEDIPELLALSQTLAPAHGALALAREASPLSTREERRLRSELAATLDNPAAAERLVAAGIRSQHDLRQLESLAPQAKQRHLGPSIEQGAQIGSSLRNLENCSQRIASLVRSLRLYARSDQAWDTAVDLNATIEDALLILQSRLRDHTVEKDYASLSPIACIPSQLQQVWTNLIQNAAQAATEGQAHIKITTTQASADTVEIRIQDHGCGIPSEAQPLIFSPRFTTKSGRVEFGLGLGLPICKTVIERHGGTIQFHSEPGCTIFTVRLPIDPPVPKP